MNALLITFVLLLVLKAVASLLLDWLNLKHVRSLSGSVPESFRDFMDAESYTKSIEYTVAKTRFGMLNNVYDALVLAVVILTGLLPWLYGLLSGAVGGGIWAQAVVLFTIMLMFGLLEIPFDWWSTFKLEERFGFNKSTQKLWLADKVRGLVLGMVIGLPLLALLIYLVQVAGLLWWVWGFAVFFLFQLVMTVAYPMFIMPLFNKLEALEEGDLKKRLFELADRTGFKAQTILAMDGSKRSGHSNAFFAGFGNFRRIVLYDTLIEQMDAEEIEAVLAHEIGHYKLGHIPKMIAMSGLMLLGMFALLGWLSAAVWFVEGFHFENLDPGQMIVPVFLLVMLMSGLVTFWLSPLSSCLSRKHEYEADAFARGAMQDATPLIRAVEEAAQREFEQLDTTSAVQ